MAISPLVFLCYGRPDRATAASLVKCLWDHQVECYDYLAKPFEDRLAGESHHFRYILEAEVFVALVSYEATARELVVEEFQVAAGVRSFRDDYTRIYVCPPEFMVQERRPSHVNLTLPAFAHQGPIEDPEVYIDRTKVRTTDEIGDAILGAVSRHVLSKIQVAWETNKSLYPDHFEALQRAIIEKCETPVDTETPADVLLSVDGGLPADKFLGVELEHVRDDLNRRALLCLLSRVLAYADPQVAKYLSRISGGLVVGREVDALLAETRRIAGSIQLPCVEVADVVRGIARIVGLLVEGRSAPALTIAQTITWQRTQRVVLAGIYGCARSMGQSESAQDAYALIRRQADDAERSSLHD